MAIVVAKTCDVLSTALGVGLDAYGIYLSVESHSAGAFSFWLWGIGTANIFAGQLGLFGRTSCALATFFLLHSASIAASVGGAVVLRTQPATFIQDMRPPVSIESFLEAHALYISNILIAVSLFEIVCMAAHVQKWRVKRREDAEEHRAI
jgi:hypothetical protein